MAVASTALNLKALREKQAALVSAIKSSASLASNWRTFNTNSSSNNLRDSQHSLCVVQRCLSWNVDGDLLAASGSDSQISLYKFGKLESNEKPFRERTFTGHQSSVEFVKFHPKKPNLFISCSDDKSVKLWDIKSSKYCQSSQLQNFPICLDWSPSGRFIAVADIDDMVCIMDSSLRILYQTKLCEAINGVMWSKDENSLFAITERGKLKQYSFPTFNLETSASGHLDSCVSIRPAHDWSRFFVSSKDSLISVWDAQTKHCPKTITKFDCPIIGFDISSDDQFIAAITSDCEIGIVAIDTDEKIYSFNTQLYPVNLEWNPKFNLLAYSTDRSYESSEPFVRFVGVH